MRNVTITLQPEIARWARVAAAKKEVSLSRFVADMLSERMQRDRSYETAMARNLSVAPRALKDVGARYPTRADLHERS